MKRRQLLDSVQLGHFL